MRCTVGLGWGLLFAWGCGGSDPGARYMVPHGSVVIETDAASGYLVWEVFSDDWAKDRDASEHLCAQVLAFEGALGDPTSCEGCEVVYDVETTLIESDCTAPSVDGVGGIVRLGLGEVPGELSGQAPSSQDSLGWYVSWDGGAEEGIGFATPEDGQTGLDEGDRLELLGGYVYDLAE